MDWRTAYSNTRVKAMKSKLLSSEQVRELFEVKTLPEVIALLEETCYKNSFVTASTKYSGMELVKRALDAEVAATLGKIASMAPKKAAKAVNVVIREWEAHNASKVVTALALGKPVGAEDLVVIGKTPDFMEKMIKATTMKQAVNALALEPSYTPFIRKAQTQYSKEKDYRVFIEAIYLAWLTAVAEEAEKEKDLKTRALLADYVTRINLITVLRLKASGVPNKVIPKFLAPSENSLVKELLEEEDFDKTVDLISSKYKLGETAVKALKEHRLAAPAEIELQKRHHAMLRKTLSRSVLSSAPLLAMMMLKHEETHTLRKIAYATAFQTKEELRETLI